MILTKLLLIAFIVVFIVDISGAVESFKSLLKWLLTKGKMKDSNYILKPVDCSLCQIFWCGLAYLLFTGNFTIPYIGFVCLLSYFSDILKSAILLVGDVIKTVYKLIYKLIDKV